MHTLIVHVLIMQKSRERLETKVTERAVQNAISHKNGDTEGIRIEMNLQLGMRDIKKNEKEVYFAEVLSFGSREINQMIP